MRIFLYQWASDYKKYNIQQKNTKKMTANTINVANLPTISVLTDEKFINTIREGNRIANISVKPTHLRRSAYLAR